MANNWLDIAVIFAMVLLSLWVSAQFGQLGEGRQAEANVANVYTILAVMAMAIAMGAAAHFGFFRFEGFNKPLKEIAPLFAVGAVAGFLITASGRLALTKLLGAGSIDPTLSFTFIVILAVFVEEFFFRAAFFPSLEKFFSGKTHSIIATGLAALIVSAVFAFFHIVATGGDQSRLFGEFLFSILQISMLKFTGSVATPIGSHFARNLITGG